jgi:hypothetical protein
VVDATWPFGRLGFEHIPPGELERAPVYGAARGAVLMAELPKEVDALDLKISAKERVPFCAEPAALLQVRLARR